MDNVKNFEDFLGRMQGLLDEAKRQGHIIVRVEDLEKAFPELKESDDERIRKELIEFVKSRGGFKQEYIAWLEKQGAKKPINEVKPKFHEGDWIIRSNKAFKHNTYLIKEVKDYYVCEELKGRRVAFTFDDVHKNFKLWDISDAKPGDVLANDYHILILKELSYDWSSDGTPNSVKAYCGIKPNGNFEIGKDNWCFCGTLNIHPATKEQRDTLFAKMRESGYEWDADKKELKKIITKQKFKVGDWIISSVLGTAHIIGVNDYDEYQLEHIDGYKTFSSIDYVNYEYDKWTIQDAKPGDILSNGEMIVIFKHFEEPLYYRQHIVAYVGLDVNGKIQITDDTWSLGIDKAKPATKEQSELLFSKMKEVGCMWDDERKEIVQNL